MRDRLWIGALWHQLLYPELGPAGYEDPEGMLTSAVRRAFGSALPEYVVAGRIDFAGASGIAEQRAVAACVLRGLHSHLSPRERQLLGFVHSRFLYFCGGQNDGPWKTDAEALTRRLHRLARQLREEQGALFTVGLAFRKQIRPENSLVAFRETAQYAVVALRTQLQVEKGCVCRCDSPRRGAQTFLVKPLAQQLERIAHSGDLEAVPGACMAVSRFLFGSSYIPLLKVRWLFQLLLVSLSMAAQAAGVDPDLLYSLNQHYFESILTLYDYAEIEKVIHAAITRFVAEVHAIRARELEHPAVGRAEAFVIQNVGNPLSLSVVAKAIGLSAAYLSRLFRAHRGVTLTEFINRERVDAAKSLLKDPGMSVGAAAFNAGFGSVQHFNRVFKSVAGCTPTQYRLSK